MANTEGKGLLSFAESIEAARSVVAEANAETDATLAAQAPADAVPVVDQVSPQDVLEHPQAPTEAVSTESTSMFDDVADALLTPNPFGEEATPRPTNAVTPETTVPIDGHGEVTVAELTNGYLRQADYTKKTQELAEQRKAFEAESAAASKLMDALKNDPAGTIASLAVEVGLIQESDLRADVISRINQDHRVPSREEMERQIEERAKALVEADPRIQEAEDARLMKQVEDQFAELERIHGVKFSERDQEAILQNAVNMGTMRIDLAYLDLKQKADTIRSQRQTAAASAPQTSQAGRVTDSTNTQPETPPSNMREAWARAKAQLS